jgi:hypothetical protein
VWTRLCTVTPHSSSCHSHLLVDLRSWKASAGAGPGIRPSSKRIWEASNLDQGNLLGGKDWDFPTGSYCLTRGESAQVPFPWLVFVARWFASLLLELHWDHRLLFKLTHFKWGGRAMIVARDAVMGRQVAGDSLGVVAGTCLVYLWCLGLMVYLDEASLFCFYDPKL